MNRKIYLIAMILVYFLDQFLIKRCLSKTKFLLGGKLTNYRLIILPCVNMIVEIETPLIIGKSLKSDCFKAINVSILGVN